ncbi:MAG: glycerate kinase, partial [Bacillota bacterium]
MRIVIAPDSYKGSATALQVGGAMADGLRAVWPEAAIDLAPVADGGQGTVDALVLAAGGTTRTAVVTGPLGAPVNAKYGILADGTAVIEMAQASGLMLVKPGDRNPLVTTTYGTGELIRTVLEGGARTIIVGIGGSATNDGGAGMAQALGVSFLDENGREIGRGGGELARVTRVDLSRLHPAVRNRGVRVLVACDVDNPLCGPAGASRTYGPQKGATPEMVERLDDALARFAGVVERAVGRGFKDSPGAGAAGGLGFGLMAFLGARLEPGIQIVANAARLKERIQAADLVITGEGCTDWQTAHGKTAAGVARIARECGVPAIIISGGLGAGHERVYDAGASGLA